MLIRDNFVHILSYEMTYDDIVRSLANNLQNYERIAMRHPLYGEQVQIETRVFKLAGQSLYESTIKPLRSDSLPYMELRSGVASTSKTVKAIKTVRAPGRGNKLLTDDRLTKTMTIDDEVYTGRELMEMPFNKLRDLVRPYGLTARSFNDLIAKMEDKFGWD